jgi:hypothetical protein
LPADGPARMLGPPTKAPSPTLHWTIRPPLVPGLSLRRLAPLCVAIGCVASEATAQTRPDTSMVSRELVTAIVRQLTTGGLPGGFPDIPTGTPTVANGIPPSITNLIGLPGGSTVLGSVSWPRYTDVYGVARGTVDDVRAWFAADFLRRRYRPIDQYSQMQMMMGGFRDPGPSPATGYCTAAQLLTVSVVPREATSAEFRVRVSNDDSQCARPMGRRAGFVDPNNLPTLYNPPTAQQTYSNCADRQLRASGTSVELSTSISPTDLMNHYGKQMGKAGWKQLPVPSVATTYWTKQDSTGTESLLTLTVTSSLTGPDCRSAQMMISGRPH